MTPGEISDTGAEEPNKKYQFINTPNPSLTQKIFHQLIEVAAKQLGAERMHEDNDLVIKHILPLSTSAKIEDISPDGIQGLKGRLEQDKTDIVHQAGIRYRMALLLGNDVYKSIPDDADHYWVLHLFQADDDGRGVTNRIQKTFAGGPHLSRSAWIW